MRTTEKLGAAPAVSLEGATRIFSGKPAVDRLTLRVPPGTCLVLLGANGAGKTTTLRLVAGLLSPTCGSVRVEGLEVRDHLRRVKERVGMVPQDDALDPDLSAAENLWFHARYAGLGGPRARAAAARVLERVGLADRAGASVGQLSSGLRRRLVLARALLCAPGILLLDEPTRGLDGGSRERFLDTLLGLKASGTTLLLATHDRDEADLLGDRAVLLDRGRLAGQGAPGELAGRAPLLRVAGGE